MKRVSRSCLIAGLSLVLPLGAAMAQEGEQAESVKVPCPASQMETRSEPMPGCPHHGQQGMMGGMMGGHKMCRRGGMRHCGTHDPLGGMRHRFSCLGACETHAEELGLSDEQTEEISEVWAGHDKAAVQAKADLKVAHMELGEILAQSPVDFSKARSKLEEIGSMKQQMGLDMFEAMEKTHDVLTDEQVEKLGAVQKHSCCKGMKHGKMGTKKCEKMKS
jgi:Spy/CpxP family protein refolding chaperone